MPTLSIELLARIGRRLDEEKGQGLAEYGLVMALVAVLAIAALALIGAQVVGELSISF